MSGYQYFRSASAVGLVDGALVGLGEGALVGLGDGGMGSVGLGDGAFVGLGDGPLVGSLSCRGENCKSSMYTTPVPIESGSVLRGIVIDPAGAST